MTRTMPRRRLIGIALAGGIWLAVGLAIAAAVALPVLLGLRWGWSPAGLGAIPAYVIARYALAVRRFRRDIPAMAPAGVSGDGNLVGLVMQAAAAVKAPVPLAVRVVHEARIDVEEG